MKVYDVGFLSKYGYYDETQLEIEERNAEDEEIIEMINLILSLQNEMGIKEIIYIEYVDEEDC